MFKKPSNIGEPDELRPAVIKEKGSTVSERYLAQIAERSFLNLWSYPTPYRDQRTGGSGDGKELCDLLVVCGDHVIIFSEKTISWPSGATPIAWRRWSKNAIRDAVKQIKGAERWLDQQPERIFIDRHCKYPFPIALPSVENRKIHRIVVASGAAAACKDFLGRASGSLIIDPSIVGEAHWPRDEAMIRPFRVGDIDPHGPLVHVFDETALNVVMSELDTVTDFTEYLTKKEAFVRSGKLRQAEGEENLVAYFAVRVNDQGLHDFTVPPEQETIAIDHRLYSAFVSDPRYRAKKEADRISYLWDRLIEVFTTHMLKGTSLVPDGFDYDLKKLEIGVRYMALEARFPRRSYGEAIAGALERGKTTDRFSRVMMPGPTAPAGGTGFFIQTFKYLDFMEEAGGYAQYRKVRSNQGQIYAEGLLEKYPRVRRVVGILREPPGQSHGVSEDLIYFEKLGEWTEKEREEIRANCRQLGFLNNVEERKYAGSEFPHVQEIDIDALLTDFEPPKLNRKQRRALRAKSRKSSGV